MYLAPLVGMVDGRLGELTALKQGGRGAPREDLLDKPEQLGRLRDKGVLTPEEFEVQKKHLLS